MAAITVQITERSEHEEKFVPNNTMDNYYVCWLLANKCNLACKFCWALWDDKNPSQSSTAEAKQILQRMKDIGINKVNFTGGEPLLRSDIVELVKFSKELGQNSFLTTNCLLATPQILDGLSEALDWLCVSLDGSNTHYNQLMRESDKVFESVLKVIKHPRKYKLKVNTVVSSKNYVDVKAIGDLLSQCTVDKWKIFPFTEREYNREHADSFGISMETFKGVYDDVVKTFPSLPIEIFNNSQRQHGVMLVNASGLIYTVDKKNDYVEVGSVFDKDIEKKLHDLVSQELNETIEKQSYEVLKQMVLLS